MNWRALTRRERIIVGVTLSTFVAVLLYTNFIEPAGLRWLDARERGSNLSAERSELKLLLANRSEIEKGYSAIEGAVVSGQSYEALQLALMGEVLELARQSGLIVSNFKPLARQTEGRFEGLSMQLSAGGEHHQVVKLLQVMQRRDRLLRGDSITILAGRGRSPLDITIEISKLVRMSSEAV